MRQAITYDDVLLVPSYNNYESRREVDISVTDKTGKLSMGLPIFTSNMDTITDHNMAKYIHSKGGRGVLHRFMSIEDNILEYRKSPSETVVSIGCANEDLERAEALYDVGATYFCVDVAHAHAKYVGRTIKRIREMFRNNVCIIAGNVATYAGADYLAGCNTDIIKVGIGGGCFVPNTMITLADGTKKEIQNIKLGDFVYTHTGEKKEVVDLFEYDRDEEIIHINNNLKCTSNHEIYVVHKTDVSKVTEDNLQNYAKWIRADELTDEYFLVEFS